MTLTEASQKVRSIALAFAFSYEDICYLINKAHKDAASSAEQQKLEDLSTALLACKRYEESVRLYQKSIKA